LKDEEMNNLKEYITILKECQGFKDRFAIVVYMFGIPIRVFYRLINKKIRHSLLYGVYLENQYGKFYCGDNMLGVRAGASSFENEVKHFFSLDEGVFIDVGAHIGRWTITIGNKLKGKVIAIEPQRDNFNILKRNIYINKLNDIVIPLDVACGDKEKEMKFYLDLEGGGGHESSLVQNEYNKNKFTLVNVRKLDNIFVDLKLDSVDLIKVDVEGSDLDVLKGAKNIIKKFHPRIIFEAFGDKEYNEIKNFLGDYNYKFQRTSSITHLAY
jgi:FkbM family methyltransferase